MKNEFSQELLYILTGSSAALGLRTRTGPSVPRTIVNGISTGCLDSLPCLLIMPMSDYKKKFYRLVVVFISESIPKQAWPISPA